MTNPTTAPAAPENKISTVADLRAAYPSLVAQIEGDAITSGATAERTRILGIEAIAVTGHEALIEGLKQDGKTSPAEAALAILGAEKSVRAAQLKGIESVEAATGAIKPSVSAAPAPETPTEKASTPDGWREEYAKSPALQSEFSSADVYVAFKKADQSGVARIKKS